MLPTTSSDRIGHTRAGGRIVFAPLACLLMAGLLGAAEAYSVHLGTNTTVCGAPTGTDLLSITVPLQPEQGDTLYVFAKNRCGS
jgi:hypothetical protein